MNVSLQVQAHINLEKIQKIYTIVSGFGHFNRHNK